MSEDTPATLEVATSGVSYRLVRTERAGSAEDSAALQGIELGRLIRTIIVRRGAGDYVFVLVPGGRQIDWALRIVAGSAPAHTGSSCTSTPRIWSGSWAPTSRT